jgi:hypothetical protein
MGTVLDNPFTFGNYQAHLVKKDGKEVQEGQVMKKRDSQKQIAYTVQPHSARQ